MKKKLLILAGAVFALQMPVSAQRLCGFDLQRQAIIARNPAAAAQFEQQRNSLQSIANEYIQNHNSAEKTTTTSAIPVIFHIVIDTAQFLQLGGTAGIQRRCDSQIAVLNRDYNRQNPDSTLIPAGFKPVYGNVGIHFGLAHTSPTGHGTPGFEVKIITPNGFSGSTTSYSTAKHVPTGMDAWNVSEYLNVWCINFLDVSGLLGITTPWSFTGFGGYPSSEVGICILYDALGKRVSASDVYVSGIDKGRTLTHECGHFFEIWHTWGDDGGLCPPAAGSADDGFTDTPPEADATYGNPTLPKFDACSATGNGIMCMNFMDYTNDAAMQMFTQMQAAAMKTKVAVGGESYSLTQNPTLLLYPAGVSQVEQTVDFSVFPNPASGAVNVIFNGNTASLEGISIMDLLGREIKSYDTNGQQKDFFSIDLSGMSKGIYMVKCNFASGSITRKILLQ